jgi:hypothetical protein
MQVWKRTVASEWLLFLVLLAMGIVTWWACGSPYEINDFWNHNVGPFLGVGSFTGFTFPKPEILALWFAPYLMVLCLRMIWWSIKTLFRTPRG